MAVLREYIFNNVEWVEVHKMSEDFWAKFYWKWVIWLKWVKWVIFLASFCWFWDFLLTNHKLKENLIIWGFESFLFWSKCHFFGTVLDRFSQCNFKIFGHQPIMVTYIFIRSANIKSLLRPCSFIAFSMWL